MARRIRKQREFIVRIRPPRVKEHYRVLAYTGHEAMIHAHNQWLGECNKAGNETIEVNPRRV